MRSVHSFGKTILIISVGLGFLGQPDPAEAQPQGLLSRARERGTLRVIVQVRHQGFKPEGSLSSQAVQSQRQAISAAQDRLVRRLAAYGPTSVRSFRHVPFLAMEVDSAALSALLSSPDAISVQEDIPVRWVESLGGPRSIDVGTEPVSPSLAESTSIIGADRAWASGYSGDDQAVAVLDTGVQADHPFLSGKVISEACFSSNVPSWSSSSLCPGGAESSTEPGSGSNCDLSVEGCYHGTHVAGISAGRGTSFSGVARDADLIAIQVFSRFDDAGLCDGGAPCVLSWTSDQILGLERVLELSSSHNIAAVNMSLGGNPYLDQESCDTDNAAQKAAIDNLRSMGIATVIASGNNGFTNALSAPGCISTAVSVGSTSNSDTISGFSNEAPFLSLYAPGEHIFSSVPYDLYATLSGTSMATPHVAGSWAILKQRAPLVTVTDGLSALQTTGTPITSTPGTWETPRINVDLAVDAVTQPILTLDTPMESVAVSIPFNVSGWCIDRAASVGTGVEAVEVSAVPDGGGAAIFLGTATLGIHRPGVAALYGSQFEPSGFVLNVTTALPIDSYMLEVSGRTKATGRLDVAVTRRLTITAPQPEMWVDTPLPRAEAGWPFEVTGWAIDRTAATGTGVDAVHVWARPEGGTTEIFLGEATLGLYRPGLAASLGSRFGPSGFHLSVMRLLRAGNYILRVLARSTVSGTFNNLTEVPITVPGSTWIAIDTPTEGTTLGTPFTVSGWAVNNSSPNGPGVEEAQVWADPAGGGNSLFLGGAPLTIARPGVVNLFQDPEFENSGFRLQVTDPLPLGPYRLRVLARLTASGTLDLTTTGEVAFTVASAPLMVLDTPSPGALVSLPFQVAGWAIDRTVTVGTGVNAVFVWAHPLPGGASIPVGAAQLGFSRPGVAASYGANFERCGYLLNVTGLPPGVYRLQVFSRSTVTQTWNNWVSADITVQ